jgi:hypothetical protein
MAAAEGFLNASSRLVTYIDLTNYTSGRMVVNKQATAGAANSRLWLKYRDSFNTTATNYSFISAVPIVAPINVQNTVIVTPWQALLPAARSGVYISINMVSGDGVLDPVMGNVYAHFI